MMKQRWLVPGLAATVLFVLMNLAKDSTPWPVHLAVSIAFLGCAGLTMLFHSRDRAAPRR